MTPGRKEEKIKIKEKRDRQKQREKEKQKCTKENVMNGGNT